MRRSAAGVRRSRAQAAARRAVNATRSSIGSWTTRQLSVAASKALADLNEIARASTRPSTSGSATFIARSRGLRPRVLSRHHAASLPASTTWSTTASQPANGPEIPSAPGVETAKPVAFSTTSGPVSASTRSTTPAAAGSLRLVTASATASSPSASSAASSRSIGARSPLWSRAR